MAFARAASTIMAGMLAAVLAAQDALPLDPFAFLDPVVSLDASARADLARGRAIARTLPSGGRDVAVFAAAPLEADADRVVAWIRRIADLKRSEHVEAIGRFSHPPVLEDLVTLSLNDDDLQAIRRCRPGDCDLKLDDGEIARLRAAALSAGDEWRAAVLQEFREVVLARATAYLDRGLTETVYHDRDQPFRLDLEFDAILAASPFLDAHMPGLSAHLRRFPEDGALDVESFLYWSKEAFGGKPVVAVTHVNVLRPVAPHLPDLVVAARQVYASHYFTGSLALTMLLAERTGEARYLAYLNRSRVDVVGGFFGWFARGVVERRLRGEAGDLVDALARRIDGGLPQGQDASSS